MDALTSSAFTWSLADGNNYTGEVNVIYMNMVGRICTDDWDDKDATVACKELGYTKGKAYTHYKYSYYADNGPFWTSKMNCAGTERRLSDCSRTQLGKVTSCQNSHSAGVLCGDNVGIYYSLSDGGPENAGRVEVSVNGVRGSICRSYFDSREARVMCRSLGYNTGVVDYYTKYPNATGPVYQSNFRCTGNEASLSECPHQGWKVATSRYCLNHNYDAAVTCYGDIKLASGFAPDIKQGPVQVWKNNTWHYVCDTNFDDLTARVVCKSLGFVDGKALCCSAYGSKYVRYSYYGNGLGSFLPNTTMNCDGTQSDPMSCLAPGTCSHDYASVVCFNSSDVVQETYTLGFDDTTSDSGQIAVQHYNVKGRICNTFWTDTEATVFCKGLNYDNGIAYHHSVKYNYQPLRSRGPFWLSAVNCTGSEASLTDCAYKDRMSLGNCSSADIASAICFNGDKSIQYRMVAPDGTQQNYGRVEMSVGGVWGTVCDRYFDNREAGVFCRQMGYKDGYAIPNAFYGQGSGPIWLSGLQCVGTEPSLHSCPHSGYNSEVVSGYSYWSCQSHRDDVSVFCVDNVKLNTGLNSSMGAVEVYANNKWNAVCDSGFDLKAARVVCRTMGFNFGINMGGSLFGITDGPIAISQVTCNGLEANFKQCSTTSSTTCKSGTYASVVCSSDPITDTGFIPRLVADDIVDDYHGFLEVRINGIWGSVCGSGFDDRAANIACKQLNFKGGVAYSPAVYNPFHSTGQHIISEKRPILMTDVVCNGNEDSLAKCAYKSRSTTNWCDYYAPRAGLLCYKNSGIQYRLVSAAGDSPLQGRIEMKYDNRWGTICDASVSSNTAKVACKSLGHVDGLPVSSAAYKVANDNRPIWFHYFKCYGNETTLPTCMNDGFYSSLSAYSYWWSYYCKNIGPASAKCYNKEIKVTNVRLVDGPTNNTGRVEVFLQGPDKWGTVCDDLWDDRDATVACMMFGYARGKAISKAFYGQGKGPIWMDNLGCRGNESHLQDCPFNGFAIQNCRHTEDAGVECSGVLPTTTSVPTGGPVTQKIKSDSPQAAAIAVPIVCALIIAAAVCGFLYYRRRYKNKDNLTKGLVPDIPASTSRGGFGVSLGGGSAFFSKSTNEADVSGCCVKICRYIHGYVRSAYCVTGTDFHCNKKRVCFTMREVPSSSHCHQYRIPLGFSCCEWYPMGLYFE
ncbi:scavenger receptor cysteine-rich type 1 protein M130-like [Haliotis asinina]|uniref:scavenger receptor cysteine-rich type 1 protein M130-like n=1 Tax=Haliotis asinina TaxID=109174 RepID=UPI003531C27C